MNEEIDLGKFEPISLALIRRQIPFSILSCFDTTDEKKLLKISIEEYEEQDDNNDCGN